MLSRLLWACMALPALACTAYVADEPPPEPVPVVEPEEPADPLPPEVDGEPPPA